MDAGSVIALTFLFVISGGNSSGANGSRRSEKQLETKRHQICLQFFSSRSYISQISHTPRPVRIEDLDLLKQDTKSNIKDRDLKVKDSSTLIHMKQKTFVDSFRIIFLRMFLMVPWKLEGWIGIG
ncbi:hypothetical protein Hdeb2414_s0001g00035931 [Helianthus debilis subsp. tardiflorus]